MKLVFGLQADGRAYPDFPGGAIGVLGEAVVGPRGLLDILETQLGLTGPSKAEAVRIAAYSTKLANALTRRPSAFFARSFEKDSWSTAERLLRWRDDLMLAGWNGAPVGAGRIDDLAAAEDANLPLGFADRFVAVARALRAKPALDIAKIEVIDPPASLPSHISDLLGTLRACGVALDQISVRQPAATKNDLAVVGQYLLTQGRGQAQQDLPELKGDGSFAIVRADTALMAGEAVAEWLAAGGENALAHTVVICASGDTALLDSALRARGLPALGQSAASQWRGALQVLPLAFAIAWKPFDPKPLMELLLLGRSPIGRSAARKLAFALSEEPGTGAAAWDAAWTWIEAKERERAKDDPGAAKIVAARLDHWRAWCNGGLYDRKAGIPVAEANRIADRVAQWATRPTDEDNDPLLRFVAGAARALSEAIDVLGVEILPALLIERMIGQVLAEGAANPTHIATAGGLRCVGHPGAIWGSAKRIVWWNFVGPGEKVAAPADPWSVAELEALTRAGCTLDTARTAAQRISHDYANVVLRTTDTLMLVRPVLSDGEETTAHPLAHQLVPLFKHSSKKADWSAETLLRKPECKFAGRTIVRRPADTRALPAPVAVWALPAAVIAAVRDRQESATGLEGLVDCQLRWILERVLHLSRGRFAEIPENNRLLGTLAHEIAAKLFEPGKVPDDARISTDAGRLFDTLVGAIAAPLQQPENVGDFVRARSHIPGSLAHLAALLRKRKLTVVGTELDRERVFDGVNLGGRLDMLVKDREGSLAVIDLKWSRSARRRREEVQTGTAIQLAVYGAIADEAGGRLVPGGYYMLNQRQLIGERGGPVSEVEIDADKDLPQIWRDLMATWKAWRTLALNGTVVARGVVNAPAPPEGVAVLGAESPCDYCDYTGLCRVAAKES